LEILNAPLPVFWAKVPILRARAFWWRLVPFGGRAALQRREKNDKKEIFLAPAARAQ
jgi:hypothetical protein